MKQCKGMTLVEIVISLAILSVITLMFAQGVVKQLLMLQSARAITENVFASAKEVERTMQEHKDAIKNIAVTDPDSLPTPSICPMFSGTPDERIVTYYPVTDSIKDNTGAPSSISIFSIVALDRPPDFEVPIITNLDTHIKNSGDIVEGSYVLPSTSVEVTAEIDKSEILLMTKYQWYMSGGSYPLRCYVTSVDSGMGEIPIYPKDFTIIPNENASRLLITPDMAGKHVLCVVSPASLEGKMGRSVVGSSKYIYGLTVLNNLVAHYDASLIDGPVNGLDSNRTRLPEDSIRVNVWPDISGKKADAEPAGGCPAIKVVDFTKLPGMNHPIKAQQVIFDGTSYMEPTGLSINPTEGFSMFAVVRVQDISKSVIISNGDAWSFDASSFTGITTGKWYILGLNSNSERTVGMNANIVTGDPIGEGTGFSTIKIGSGSDGNSKIELAELIIYNDVLSPEDDDWKDITQYLGDKYNLE